MEGMFNYYIPDDGDSPDHLNVFPLPLKAGLKLAHIKKAFPLPGSFHFRFKQAFEGTYVWLDIADNDPVPEYNGVVISKVARVVDKAEAAAPAPAPVKAAAVPSPPKVEAPPAVPDLIETSTPSAAKDANAKVFNDDLVGLMSTPTASPRVMSPVNQPKAPVDPFNLFAGGAAPPMRPPTPHGAQQGFQNAPYMPPGGAGGFPMGPPRAPMNSSMNISNMNMNPMMGGGPRPAQGPPMGNNGFNNLQWQGMQQPPNGGNPMMRPPTNNPNQRSW
ncbi:hypothetical protein SPRG_13480 [Saprolegnia parasitica CBS 223.65]|uniref:DIX domain-containing protein n=1 Tax=Saprolegnia parasitica (strain CBS 223.65) TaxID=695850 RepID=A0A067BU24_SAPPC|nr:hypothetical protein SPRG_13480 [Saprolegnia parasitica CBS 223.65]KDO20335.1 hypothetical protein SPRG_13480 [Saprolegnia parasitica CBS 223.65]|eukprot:XP_012208933.1 hypothetical protein SPRG_13480 [Saprolegnia parasitica CBS 223.65]